MKRKIAAMCATVALAAVAAGGTLAYFTDVEDQANAFTVGDVDIVLDEQTADPDDGYARTQEDQEYGAIMPGTNFAKDPTITNVGSQPAWVFLEIDLNKYVSLVNLIGVDYYVNTLKRPASDYPGFCEFVADLVEDTDLRMNALGHWFRGIVHADWEVMNADEIEELVESVAAGDNPAHMKVVLGYAEVLEPGGKAVFMREFGMPATVTSSMLDGEDAYRVDGVSKSNFNTEKTPFRMAFTAYAVQEANVGSLEAAYRAIER